MPVIFSSFCHSATLLALSQTSADLPTSQSQSQTPMDDDVNFSLHSSPPSLKQKLKNSVCFSCCFPHRQRPPPPPPSSDENPALIWEEPSNLPNIKDKVLTVFNFIGNGNRHKRHSSTEFRYDPMSYSLNFEDGFDDEEAPLRNFTTRLPSSPPVKPLEVTAAS